MYLKAFFVMFFCVFLGGCQPWRPIGSSQFQMEVFSLAPENVLFPEGRFVDDCLTTQLDEVQACIFGKNLVADVGRRLSSSEQPALELELVQGRFINIRVKSDVSHMQRYAVSFPSHLEELKNEDFIIESILEGSEFSRNVDGNWKYAFKHDPDELTAEKLTGVYTFYWINYLAERIRLVTGHFYPEGAELLVQAFTPYYVIGLNSMGEPVFDVFRNAAWSRSRKALIFGVSVGLHIPLGLDASLVAHELGHAILDYASEVDLSEEVGSLEQVCESRALCSTSVKGSIGAIHEGIADTISLFLFPQSTAIGELIFNSPGGLAHGLRLPRDVSQIKRKKLQAINFFEGCEPRGEIHCMGSIYSTIWYGVFQRALARGGEAEREEAYRLFFEHMKNITTNDTFPTLKAVVKAIDENLFEGRFSEDLEAEYALLYPPEVE